MRVIQEFVCQCHNCQNQYSYSNIDIAKNKEGRWGDLASTVNLTSKNPIESSMALNHQRESYRMDFDKCPKCGSRKITKKANYYYVDNNGNYAGECDKETIKKVSKKKVSIGDILYGSCAFSFFGCLIIMGFLILYIIFNVLSIFF